VKQSSLRVSNSYLETRKLTEDIKRLVFHSLERSPSR
jgi:hypothetical protein